MNFNLKKLVCEYLKRKQLDQFFEMYSSQMGIYN